MTMVSAEASRVSTVKRMINTKEIEKIEKEWNETTENTGQAKHE